MSDRRTLLAIFAHPDDESFGPGGTLARYAAEGHAVHVIIATDGIAGSVEDSHHLTTHATLAQVRSGELADAAVALGVTSIWSLPYRDSGMRGSPDNAHPDALIQQPVATTAVEILDHVQRLRPDVIVTHDPFGGYGHPDHVRVCEAAAAAFYQARRTAHSSPAADAWPGPQKLYYTAGDRRLTKIMARVLPLFGQDPRALGRNKDIDLVEIARWHTPVTTKVAVSDYLPRKYAASQAHVSQYSGPGFLRVLPKALVRRLQATESFTGAYPQIDGAVERDLMAGLK